MSRKSLVPVNVPALASAPTTPTIRTGDLYFNTTNNTLYSYNGTAWAASGGGGGGASVSISSSAPISPTAGSLWFDSDTGQFFIYYSNYWMEVGAGSSAAPQAIISQTSAPADTSALWLDTDEPAIETIPASIVDAKGDIVVATADNAPARLAVGSDGAMLMANSSAASGLSWVGPTNVAGKNKFINGDFSINQRAFTSTTAYNAYTFDRWQNGGDGGTTTTSAQTFTPGAAPVAGYEGVNYIRQVVTGQAATTDFVHINQHIEDVRTFAGQTITVSLWARAGSGTPKIGVTAYQNFGSGGSSATITSTTTQTITTGWARYSFTLSVPSVSGKTIGTSSALRLFVFCSSGTGMSSGGWPAIGVQNNTFDYWGIQAEVGSVATPFTLAGGGSPQAELALCQRYYIRTNSGYGYGNAPVFAMGGSGNGYFATFFPPVTLRTVPSSIEFSNIALWDGLAVNAISTATINAGQANPACVVFQGAAAASVQYRPYALLNNSNAAGYLAFSAEL